MIKALNKASSTTPNMQNSSRHGAKQQKTLRSSQSAAPFLFRGVLEIKPKIILKKLIFLGCSYHNNGTLRQVLAK